MRAGGIRRAAGTNTFTDLLLHPKWLLDVWTGGGSDRAEADAAAFAAGEARVVSAFARRDERFVRGLLLLDPASPTPVVWRAARFPGRSGPEVVLSGPLQFHGARPVSGPGTLNIDSNQFRLVSFEAPGRHWELAVPALDVLLVRIALTRAASGD